MDLLSDEFKLESEKIGFKEWQEKQDRYLTFKRKEEALKSAIEQKKIEMRRLAALGEQYEFKLEV